MEVRFSKKEMERLIKRTIKNVAFKRWEKDEMVLEVDVVNLKKEEIKEAVIFTFKDKLVYSKREYIICPIFKSNQNRYYMILQ